MSEPTIATAEAVHTEPQVDETTPEAAAADALVEDVSIDGMCGVY